MPRHTHAILSLCLACAALFGCKQDDSSACPAAQTTCGEVCASLDSDREHCGGCGHVCEAGELCEGGACVVTCPYPSSACDGACTDTDRDRDHCGGCGRACPAGEVCVNGGCNVSCPAGHEICDGRCVVPATDAAHCGGCGTACSTGDACVDGHCAGCLTGIMEGALPARVSATATASQHDIRCGVEKSAASPDLSYAFTAASRGVYEIDSEGSEIDVVLALLDSTCRGRTLTCADTSEASRERSLRVVLEQGETVVIVAESKLAEQGVVRLRVSQIEKDQASSDVCAPVVLGSEIPKTVTGETTGGADRLGAECGAAGNPEALFQFTAPATGRYVFDTFGSNFDTVLAALEGGCAGEQIACNDDTGFGHASSVSFKLTEGETVLLLVEGYGAAGKFTLHASASSFGDIDPCCFDLKAGGCGNASVEACVCAVDDYCCTEHWDLWCASIAEAQCELSCKPSASDCEVTDLGSAVPQTVSGTTIGALDFVAPSCSADGSPERLYRFVAPEAGAYAFDTAGSAYDTVVYVLEGACDGEELACNDDYGTGATSRAIVSLQAQQAVVVAVDGFGGGADDYLLQVLRVDGGAFGDCCTPHGGTGCSVPAIQTCVCDFDPYCCDPDSGWDDICVSAAVAACQVCE